MRTIKPLWLVATAVVLAMIAWVTATLTTRASMALPVLPMSSLITMGLIAVVCFFLGLRVKRWRDGKREKAIDPLLAARTLILAQACAYAGAVLVGWHAGIFIDILPSLAMRSDFGIVWEIAALAGGGIIMVAVGVIVERFCRIPPQDPDAKKKLGEAPREQQGEQGYA